MAKRNKKSDSSITLYTLQEAVNKSLKISRIPRYLSEHSEKRQGLTEMYEGMFIGLDDSDRYNNCIYAGTLSYELTRQFGIMVYDGMTPKSTTQTKSLTISEYFAEKHRNSAKYAKKIQMWEELLHKQEMPTSIFDIRVNNLTNDELAALYETTQIAWENRQNVQAQREMSLEMHKVIRKYQSNMPKLDDCQTYYEYVDKTYTVFAKVALISMIKHIGKKNANKVPESLLKIQSSGFSDRIFEDISQEVAYSMIKGVFDGTIGGTDSVGREIHVFDLYFTRSAWSTLYTAINRGLRQYVGGKYSKNIESLNELIDNSFDMEDKSVLFETAFDYFSNFLIVCKKFMKSSSYDMLCDTLNYLLYSGNNLKDMAINDAEYKKILYTISQARRYVTIARTYQKDYDKFVNMVGNSKTVKRYQKMLEEIRINQLDLTIA